jgi:hypothetical protein
MPYYHVAITKKTGRDRWAFAFNMSFERISKEIILPFQQNKMFMCGKSVISPTDIEKIVISETEESAPKILKKTRLKRFSRKMMGSNSREDECVDEWTIIMAGKDVTRKLIKNFGTLEEQKLSEGERSKPEVSKGELENYLKEFLRIYRAEVKKRYPAYFNEFPFYSSVRAIGVISLHYVYIFFTKDGDPKKTTTEVFDENDIPDLVRTKDAINVKRDEVLSLLEVRSYIPDYVHNLWEERFKGLRSCFIEPNVSAAVDESIKNHYTNSVETGKDITWVVSGESIPSIIPKFGFVYNTMDETILSEKVKDLIERVEEGEVLVAGWVDSFGLRLLNSLIERNIKFRIVTHRPSSAERGKPPSDTCEVFGRLAKEYPESVRISTRLHARLLISDKEALVSTADLTKDSLEAKFEAGIATTDGLTIMKLKEFFEKLWDTSTKLNTPKA